MGRRDESTEDYRLMRALAHPLRVEILHVLEEGPSSPNRMAALLGHPLGNVSYHVRVLHECDCIKLVKTRQTRGSVEHFYRLKPSAVISSRDWAEVPSFLRDDLIGRALDAFTTRAVAALEAGTFHGREGSAVVWLPLAVDQSGWQEIREILDGVEDRFREVGEKAAERLKASEEIPVVVAVAAFEVDRSETEQER